MRVNVHDHDRYGRVLADIEADGQGVSKQMVADGMAWHYTRYSKDAGLAAAEREARAARRGLSADKAPVPPWEWRASEEGREWVACAFFHMHAESTKASCLLVAQTLTLPRTKMSPLSV